MLSEVEYEEIYRDSIATVDASGKRVWVFPKKPKGRMHHYRIALTIVLLGLFFGIPFIQVNGHPFFMLNIFERTFIIFGQIFYPQDFVMFALAMIIFFVFIILFTVAFGRIWCGWACPQTVFMEMVFRKIEYWIEGNRNQQRKLAEQPWNTEKVLKKGAKHAIFLLIAILIAHTAMAYLIGLDNTISIATQPPSAHWAGFIGLVAFTALFYGVFAYLREQACIAVCPYGRLQGVLVGNNTLGVIYDFVRGEPRGKLKKKAAPPEDDLMAKITQGDCIDCTLCVQVCPTGIDIRNGIQLECVNCTACIDACDEVMEKVGKPKGLIRHASQDMISKGKPFKFNTRLLAYAALLLLLLVIEGFLLLGRSPVEATVLRVPGQLYHERTEGVLSNLYNTQLVNKTFETLTLDLKVRDDFGRIERVNGKPNQLTLEAGEKVDLIFFVDIPKKQLQEMKTPIQIEVYKEGKLIETAKTNFLGP
ncbi:MAG: cytochrome c oxidase accessory protein CcoG [Thermonemataceae bacterium]